MGFEMNLLLVLPEKWQPSFLDLNGKNVTPRTCTMWRVATILKIDRISAPISKAFLKEKPARQRAALLFFECIWPELTKQLEEKKEKCFAPPFSILNAEEDEIESTVFEWKRQFQDSKDDRTDFIEPLYGDRIYEQIPSQRGMEDHSRALKENAGPNCTLDPIRYFPWVWFPCRTVNQWVTTKIANQPDDKEALAYFSMWRLCLKEMGKIDANCLFMFEAVRRIPSIV